MGRRVRRLLEARTHQRIRLRSRVTSGKLQVLYGFPGNVYRGHDVLYRIVVEVKGVGTNASRVIVSSRSCPVTVVNTH